MEGYRGNVNQTDGRRRTYLESFLKAHLSGQEFVARVLPKEPDRQAVANHRPSMMAGALWVALRSPVARWSQVREDSCPWDG